MEPFELRKTTSHIGMALMVQGGTLLSSTSATLIADLRAYSEPAFCCGLLVPVAAKISDMGIAVLIGSIALLAGLGLYFVWRYEQQRTEQFHKIARRLGLRFFAKGDAALLERMRPMQFFSRGRWKRIRNMLHGQTDDGELAIFDYRYKTHGGKNSRTIRQSVVSLRSPMLDLTPFELRPERLLDKLGGALGLQDIDVPRHPKFAEMYVLRGADERAIRELFTDDLLAFLERQPPASIEGSGEQLLFYRGRKRVDPNEVPSFMEEGLRIFAPFRGPTKA